MSHKTETQTQSEYRRHMGEPLGSLFTALWHELVWLHVKWAEYIMLFGASPERVDLLNRAAPNFFGIVQGVLLDNILLHVARITDSKESAGKRNLTVRALLAHVDSKIERRIDSLIEVARQQVEFCRGLRNRRLAHSDLALALNYAAALPLPSFSRAQVRDALQAIANVLNAVEEHYGCSPTGFEHTFPSLGGAEALLEIVETGLSMKRKGDFRIR